MNPPKFKTLCHVGPKFDFAAMDEVAQTIGERTAWLLTLIKKNKDGFRLSVALLAERFGKSEDTVRRLLRKLRDARLLVEDVVGVWRVSWRPIPHPEPEPRRAQICGSHVRDPSAEEKVKTNDVFTDEIPTSKPTTSKLRPYPTEKRPMSFADADPGDREPMEFDDKRRMPFSEFERLWVENVGRLCLGNRELHALAHWNRDEIMEALRATANAKVPGWAYFRTVLSRIASGETGPKRPRLPHEHERRPRLREDDDADKVVASPEFVARMLARRGES